MECWNPALPGINKHGQHQIEIAKDTSLKWDTSHLGWHNYFQINQVRIMKRYLSTLLNHKWIIAKTERIYECFKMCCNFFSHQNSMAESTDIICLWQRGWC